MKTTGTKHCGIAPVTNVVDDAVGVPESHWYVAIVNHNSEKRSAEKLQKLGIKNYVPAQKVMRVWRNGRKSVQEKIVIPSIIFIYCTEEQRKEIVGLPFILRFMTNKAGVLKGSSFKPLAIIPDKEIERLKFMLGQSDIPIDISTRSYYKGDKVRVIRGSLIGLEGEVIDMSPSKVELTVDMDLLGCAKLIIDTVNLELIERVK